MAAKPPAYANVELAPIAPPALVPAPMQVVAQTTAKRGRPATGRTLKDVSAPVMLYLHPAGAKALKRYAVDQNTKVHSLIIEAVEAWFKSHGLREPVRVSPEQQEGV
jgi:hypothetical protein